MNAVASERITLRTVLRETLTSRTISLIERPLTKNSRRIRATVSTTSIPPPPAQNSRAGSFATNIPWGVNFGRRSPDFRGSPDLQLDRKASGEPSPQSGDTRSRRRFEEHRRKINGGDFIAQAMAWLSWLEADHAELVRSRAEGSPWKLICWRFGISRPTAYRRWRHALELVAWRLNGRAVPTSCSRRRFAQLSARM